MQTLIVATQFSTNQDKAPAFTKPKSAFLTNSYLVTSESTTTMPPIKTESYPVKFVDSIVWQPYYTTVSLKNQVFLKYPFQSATGAAYRHLIIQPTAKKSTRFQVGCKKIGIAGCCI